MPKNVLELGPQLFSVIAGLIALLGAALAFSFKYHATSATAGERGHRPEGHENEAERVRPDGFIDSFAGVISEAGGGVPFMGWIIGGIALASWFIYLFLHWTPSG
jgi:hypothetical protein